MKCIKRVIPHRPSNPVNAGNPLHPVLFRLVLATVLIGIFYPVFSQEKELRFRHITSYEGLSNDIINCISQDDRGFIWIGTMEGLNRFDGYTAEVFKRILHDSTSLPDNMIFDIYNDHQNNLWIGTQNGISIYNPDLQNFTNFFLDNEKAQINTANRVTGIEENASNELFAAVELGTIYKLDRKTETFSPFKAGFNSIKDFVIDTEDRIWVGGNAGLYSYSNEEEGIIHYDTYLENSKPVPIRDVNTLFEEGDTLWAGTIMGRIYYFLKSEGIVKALNYDFDKTYYIYDIYKNSKGLIYISTTDGLFVYNKNTDSYITYKYEENNPHGLNTPGITTVFEDNQNNLWIGSYQGGINLASFGKEFFNYNAFSKEITLDVVNINSILEDSQENLWLGSFNQGINIINTQTNTRRIILHDPSNPNSLGYGSVYCIYEDSKKNIWVGTYLGYLQRYNPQTETFTSFPFREGEGSRNRGLDVRSIHEDGDGMLWIISHSNGLSRLNPGTGKYKHFVRNENNLDNTLADNWAFQILQDHIGYFWIATPSGLSRFDPKAETFRNYYHSEDDSTSLCNNFINVLFEDSNHRLWIGTKFGLSLFDRENNRFLNYYEDKGLPSNHIKAILEDEAGELWLSTGNGLSRMRYRTSESGTLETEFRNFSKSDNLQDIFFWERSAYKTKDEKLIFGCEQGIIQFEPDKITENNRAPDVYITSLVLINRDVRPDKTNGVLREHIYWAKAIQLKHDQNFFTFNYTAINYISNENNRYYYMLEGFDADWIDAGNNRQASYTNVDPGRYTFRVIASNNDGYWNREGASIEVIITPPFTGTWFFRISLTVLILGLAIAYYRYRVTNLRRQNAILERKVDERIVELSDLNQKIKSQNELLEEQKKNTEIAYDELDHYKTRLEDLVEERTKELIVSKEKAEEADRLKTSFLANLSHEIRTPLNSIIGFSGLMLDPDITREERISYKSIIEGSNNTLLSLINDIMDFSKMESGHLDIVFKEVILDSIFEDLQKIYSLEIKKQTQEAEKDIEFRINIDEKCKGLILVTDEIRLKQLLTILINNAIKFTYEGYIEVGCHLQENQLLEFYVEDTGIGIAPQFHKVIFERFRKLEEEKRLFRGAGIGLSIAQELVKRMGGSIELKSIPGEGTLFSFTIPVRSKEIKKITKTNIQPRDQIPDLSTKKILIAEDDISNFAYMEKLLRRTHATILHAYNGHEAIDIFEKNPDLSMIFMDIKMPELNGIEALKKLIKMNISIPVIAQTAYAFTDEIRRIKEAGFTDYLAKPIGSGDLYNLITKYLLS